MRVEVYYNLHKGCLSYRQPGGRVKHADTIALRDATFVVQPAGRERVRREKRKNVHAFVRGQLVDVDMPYSMADVMAAITYNPYRCDTFVYAGTTEPVHSAERVIIDDKHIMEIADAT